LSLFLVSCSVWPPSLLEAAFFFCYSSTALAGGYSCVTLTLTLDCQLTACHTIRRCRQLGVAACDLALPIIIIIM
jgi:hypothetical protein